MFKQVVKNHSPFQIKSKDFSEFDYIFGMDEDNMDDLKSMVPTNSKAKIELLGTYDPQGELIIRDPYYVSSCNFTQHKDCLLPVEIFFFYVFMAYSLHKVYLILHELQDSGEEGFEKCYQQCMRCCAAFLERMG